MENKQFVALPSGGECLKDLNPQEQLIYLGIRSFMNEDTMEAFPSIDKIAERIGASAPTVRKCIKKLEEKDYIKVDKTKRNHTYKFNKLKQFEPFSYDFLEDKTLSFTQRAVLASTQTHMYDKESGIGKISYSKMELAEKINMPYSTLARTTNELVKKDIMSIVPTNSKDIVSGNKKQEMQFDLQKYHQGIVKVLLNHEERLQNTEDVVSELLRRVEALEKENKILKKKETDIIL